MDIDCRAFLDDDRRCRRGTKRQIIEDQRNVAQPLADDDRALGAAAADTVGACRRDGQRGAVDGVAAAGRSLGDTAVREGQHRALLDNSRGRSHVDRFRHSGDHKGEYQHERQYQG